MRAFFTILITFISSLIYSQSCTTLVRYDYIETYNWSSGWSVGSNANYYTNASVSASASAAMIGLGNGSSALESGYYVLPNVTGLNSTSTYVLKFRLASYRFSNSTAATAGVDVSDYADVQLSTNGGTTYISELRITGNANSYWSYSSLAVASKTANGVLTTLTPTAGGDRTNTGDGYSYIQLTLPAAITQCAFYIYCRANSAGEEWWLDNIELFEIFPCNPLPIELVDFSVDAYETYNLVSWKTETELNNDRFILFRSSDGIAWQIIEEISGAGTSVVSNNYNCLDYSYPATINYYRLKQVDFDGNFEYFKIIAIDNRKKLNKVVINITDILGRPATANSTGILIYQYSDGTYEKVFRSNF
jgi:hypothetical protein